MSQKPESQNNSPKGFTLTELLVTTAIFGIVGVILVSIIVSQSRSFREQQVRNRLSSEMLSLYRPIQDYITLGSSIVDTTTIGAETFVTDQDTLVLSVPAVDGSGAMVVGEYDTLVLNRETSQLRLIILPSASSARPNRDSIITKHMNDFVIRYDEEIETLAKSISITTELIDTVSASNTTSFLSTTSYALRNS